jgi:hypothetical protein
MVRLTYFILLANIRAGSWSMILNPVVRVVTDLRPFSCTCQIWVQTMVEKPFSRRDGLLVSQKRTELIRRRYVKATQSCFEYNIDRNISFVSLLFTGVGTTKGIRPWERPRAGIMGRGPGTKASLSLIY